MTTAAHDACGLGEVYVSDALSESPSVNARNTSYVTPAATTRWTGRGALSR